MEGGAMAEASRTDAAGRNMLYSPGINENYEAAVEPRLDLPELPEAATPASNPALNRSAEVVGRSVGNAVAGVRRLPQQFEKLRSRIHVVPRRRPGDGGTDDLKEAVADWRDAAEDTVSDLTHRVKNYTDEVSETAQRDWEEFRRRMEWRIDALRRDARRQLAAVRRWESEQPLYVIGACAAAAFVAGVALRIWRSNRD
jgi:ElaB/YqjD/DUF883 family membrane-anchored ribosome-binding protein